MAYYNTSIGNDKTSAYNDAINQINRLNEIWRACQIRRERGDLLQWRWKLDSAEIELSRDIQKLDEKKENHYKGLLLKFKRGLSRSKSEPHKPEYYKTKIENMNNSLEGLFKPRMTPSDGRLAYKKLMEKEILLRAIQDESGKGTKYRSENEEFD